MRNHAKEKRNSWRNRILLTTAIVALLTIPLVALVLTA